MSFVTTHPEALAVTAGNLQTIGSALTAQNAAAAAPITTVAPAAADAVSALQATQFSAYGQLYEQISAQAAAIQEMFVHTLRVSADSYGTTEAANSAAADSTAGLGAASGTAGLGSTAAADPTAGLASLASNASILAAMQGGTIGSATSEFTGLGKGYITSPSGVIHHVDNAAAAGLVSQTGLAAPAAAAAVPVSVSAGQAPPVGSASVPPSWAGETAPAGAARPTLPVSGPSAAAAPHTSTAAVPAGMPASSTDRGSNGRLRYGVKPKVMPRPTGV